MKKKEERFEKILFSKIKVQATKILTGFNTNHVVKLKNICSKSDTCIDWDLLVYSTLYNYIVLKKDCKKVLKLNVNLAIVRMMSDDKAVEHMLK